MTFDKILNLTPAQLEIINCKYPREMFRMPRQSGKTTALLLSALSAATNYPGSKTVYITPVPCSCRKCIIDMLDDATYICGYTLIFENGSTIDIMTPDDAMKPECAWDLILLDDVELYAPMREKIFEILEWNAYPDGDIRGVGTFERLFNLTPDYEVTNVTPQW